MPGSVYQFGDFRLDCGRFELTRKGRSLSLERKPLELLILLAERKGQLVTRTEIAERLWEPEVFVDTEHGINTAIRKIRQTLRDDSNEPSFVQTVMGKGYRFVAEVAVQGDVVEESSRSDVSDGLPKSQTTAVKAAPIAPMVVLSKAAGNRWRWLVWAVPSLLVVAVTLGLAMRFWHRRAAAMAPILSLAVLPLDNLSGDPGQEYFADGMTDELTTMLAKNSTLRIVSRTSVMQYKGVHRPVREIARELGVDGILEGSVSRSGDKVHMTIQLIEAPSDTHEWAESYDRALKDVASLPWEAAVTIAKKLNSSNSQSGPAPYVSPEAHDAYLRGLYLWFTADNEKSGAYFKRATELQPDYAQGWSGLANYYLAGAVEGELNPQDALGPGDAAALKAIALDDSLPEAHLSMAAAYFFNRWDWARAEAEIARAIALNPKFVEAYHLHAKMLAALDRHQEAIAAQQKAMEFDPFERPWAMALSLSEARQYDAAIKDLQQRLEGDTQNQSLHWMLCEVYRRKGMLKEAAQEWETASLLSGDKESTDSVRRNFDKGGYRAVLSWQLTNLKRKSAKHYVSPVNFALQYAQLGQREETLALLERGYREHSPWLLSIQNDPAYDFLHSDERYRAIIQKIGLPPAY